MKYQELIQKLKENDCVFVRMEKGSHEIWRTVEGKLFVVPSHKREIPTGTCQSILKDAGLK